jgi:hypothetical protein
LSAAEPAPTNDGFRARTVLALVLVGVFAFASFGVLGVYAPELRGHSDPGAHAMSSSPVGFRGAVVMRRAMGGRADLSRGAQDRARIEGAVVVLTPQADDPDATRLAEALPAHRVLIVLPKWRTMPDPRRPGRLLKLGVIPAAGRTGEMFAPFAAGTRIGVDPPGARRRTLSGAGSGFSSDTRFDVGVIDQLQTIEGDGWNPVLTDDKGRWVLAQAKQRPTFYVLADPDLLNNQGLASLDNARAGMAILDRLQGPEGVLFDVSLVGFARERSVGRTLLEPPWLAATICALAAAALLGMHALARFGPAIRPGRAIALGASALVENSAGLVRLARKEPALAPDYLQLTEALVAEGAGGGAGQSGDWLSRLARRRGLPSPEDLSAEAAQVRTRDQLTAFAGRLYQWRQEMMRDGR